MSRALDAFNALAVIGAIAASMWGATLGTQRVAQVIDPRSPALAVAPERDAQGRLGLRDADGVFVPLQRYQRIASGSMVADRVLADLCEPTRIIAFSAAGASNPRVAPRYAGKPLLGSRAPLEQLLALKPDVLIVHQLVDASYVARLRENGVQVFALGHMRGLDSLLPMIRALGTLIGDAQRADDYAHTFERRMRALRERVKMPQTGIYLGAYGDKLYGGARDTSYHDVLEAAGLIDVVGRAGMAGWPELSPERVLSLDPQVLVTRDGMGSSLCARAGLAQLRACRTPGHVIELPAALLDDPGPGMLEAAEALQEALERTQRAPDTAE